MSVQRKRSYQSPARDAAARQTRAAIVAAATRLFVKQGFAGSSFEAVAREAGVARPTVVGAFGTKGALLGRVLDEALAGDEEEGLVRDRPWYQPVWQATTGQDTLTAYARVCVIIGARSGGVVEALHRAADSTEELEATWDRWNATRRGGARRVLDHPPLRSDLRPDLDIEAAADVLAMLNNPELHYMYVTKGDWKEPRYEAWLADAMHRLILAQA
jgi:AcrR family transcriptional regulator